MQKSTWIALLVVAVLIVGGFIAARMLYFGSGNNTYQPPQRDLTEVSVDSSAASARLKAVDNPEVSTGVVVVDFAHDNALFVEELNVLLSKLVERGYSYELVTPALAETEDPTLLDRLAYADSLIVPLARAEFSDEEIVAIKRFVEKGGKLLVIGDPTRTVAVEALNSLASPFGIIYVNDYLYSLNETSNDNNYRNVVYSNFQQSPLTEGISPDDKIIFYSGGSINAPGHEIILGDEYTYSSISEGGRDMAPAVLTTNDQVLALGDLTFLSEPYSAAESNGKLINNIANFLTSTDRSYELKDFPHFFGPAVDVVFDNTLVFNSQFEDSVKLKDILENSQRTANFVNAIGSANDAIFIGRFDETDAVQDYLDAAKIRLLDVVVKDENKDGIPDEPTAEEPETEGVVEESDQTNGTNGNGSAEEDENTDKDQPFVEGRIQIAGVGELESGGSTLFHLHQQNGQNILIILSDNPDTNADAFELLMNDELTACQVGPMTAVCQTETPDKKLPPSLRSSRINKVLVVSDDDGRPRVDDKTSVAEYEAALSSTYNVITWSTSIDGSPDLFELQEYDAVIWSTGDYWDDSIGAEDAETLGHYIDAGGNLILSGASIAFDWDHTDFIKNIVHANYLSFAPQADIEVVDIDHPIGRGLEAGQVFTLTVTTSEDEEGLQPDVVSHTADARVIFKRGSGSEYAGAASVIAYEDDRSKIAYFAFPLYTLPADIQTTLVNNTINWFTRKPLDLPDETAYEPYELDDTVEEEPVEEPTEEPAQDETGQEEQDTENGEDNNDQGDQGEGDGAN